MALIQPGTSYNVVWNGSEFIITWHDDAALADGTIFNIGVDPEAGGATAAITGTATTATESDIQSGGKTIIIELTDDTWVSTVGADNSITDALIAGIDSAQSEATGWDAEVKGNMVHGDIVRTSDTVVTITLAAESAYEITADETITVTIPAASLTAAAEVVATPTFDVTNETAGGSIVVLRRRIMEVA